LNNPQSTTCVKGHRPIEILKFYQVFRNILKKKIDSKNLISLLTGSSARKLRKVQANLIAGHVWDARMFPLIHRKIPDFNINRYLQYGGLAAVYLIAYPEEELDA